MGSRTPPPSSRRAPRQPELEDTYPHIPEPKQGHLGHLFAFISVLAVLGFGLWSAVGTLMATNDKPPPRTSPTAAATAVVVSLPTAIATATSVAAAQPRQPTDTPGTGSGRVHVVGEGDTLYRIAQRYGTTVEAIMAANGFSDRSKILHVGDRLIIP